MKTRIMLCMALIMSAVMTGQVVKTKEEIVKINKELKEQNSRLAALKEMLKTEESFLNQNSAYPDLNQENTKNIAKYTADINTILAAIKANEKLITDSKNKEVAELPKGEKESKPASAKEQRSLAEEALKNKYKTEEETSALTSKNKAAPSEAKYTFLNGVNFDFNSTDKTNYIGHFNIYVPATATNNWAINTGIMKIAYLPKDSLVVSKIENVLINPLDVIDGSGDTYNKVYNRYSAQTKASAFSLYIQPMYRFTTVGTANIYLHGHLELLLSKYETKTKIKTLQTQAVTLADGDPVPAEGDFIRVLAPETSNTVNLSTGNLGAGLTFDFNFRDNCVLFIQGTAGVSLNHANNFPTIDDQGNFTIATSEKSQKFYLVRTYFQYFTSSATQLVLGTDIRGYFPKQTPYTSIYIGINLGLDKIFSM
jgi:hypothetical protein